MAHRRSWSFDLEVPANRDAEPTEFTSLGPDGRQPSFSSHIEPIERAESYATRSQVSEDTIKDDVQISRSQRLYRSLGLESVYLIFRELRNKGHVTEERKLAIIHDFQVACYTSLLHIIPIAASVTLVVFNWKGYYIGSELSGPEDEDGLKILGLQFTAKLLELLVMSSLSCIIFAMVRDQLLSGHPLPFGAMTAGFEFSKISIFWSKEFLATCTSRFNSRKSKLSLIATIIVFAILGATIGPSAAVASQPTLRNWHAGGTSFWMNATMQALWPLTLENIVDSDLACNSNLPTNSSCFPSNQDVLASEILSYWPLSDRDSSGLQQVIPEETRLSGRKSLRTLAMRFKGPFVYQPDITVATTQSAAMADAVARLSQLWFVANRDRCIRGKAGFCNYKDLLHTIKTVQPVTFVRCNLNTDNTTLQFPRLDKEFGVFPLAESASLSYENTTTSTSTVRATLTWVELPEADFGNSSIGAIVSIRQNTGVDILACSVDARWANASSSASFLGGPLVVTGSPKEWFTTGRHERDSKGMLKWPQVRITPSWASAQFEDPPIAGKSNASMFTTLVDSLGRANNITEIAWPTNAIESILAVMLTDAMARINNRAMIQGELKSDWIDEMMPQQGVYDHGGNAFNFTPDNRTTYTKFEVRTTVNGFGYGVTTATLLSTLTLITYAVIATAYTIYSIFFARTTSSAWESITEMLALAMNSPPPVSGALDNTGAGISTLSTLKKGVRIAVRDEKLQLDFDAKEDLDLVRKNAPYN